MTTETTAARVLREFDAMMTALAAARQAVVDGDFLASHIGACAVDAMHTFTGVDGLHDLAQQIAFDAEPAPRSEPYPFWKDVA